MPSYLVETYAPVSQAAAVHAAVARLIAQLGAVRHVRATFVPEDETWFHLVEGPSAAAVGEALTTAEVPFERIVETTVVSIDGDWR